MHNGNDGWLTPRLMSVVLLFCVTLALNGAWVYASIKRWKTKEEGMPLAVSRSYICSVFRNHVAYWVVCSVGLRQGAVDNVFGYSQNTTELMFPIETIALIAIFWPSLWLAQTLATRTTCSEDPSCRVAEPILPQLRFNYCQYYAGIPCRRFSWYTIAKQNARRFVFVLPNLICWSG